MAGKGGKFAEDPPTVRPPFDLAEFARQSDSRLRVEPTSSPDPPSRRPTVPPDASSSVVVARMSDVPALAMSREDLDWFELSPSARALVQQVNGRDTVEAISRNLRRVPDDVLVDLDGLAREGVVTWR